MQTTVYKLTKYQPRNNLPAKTSSKRKESNLLLAFLRWYVQSLKSKKTKREHFFIREIDLNGYGIADLLLLESVITKKTTGSRKKIGYITTFEIKIKDWRKAVKQAIRYRYYSNRVIVVLPKENINNALVQINVFKWFNVGLWSFDKKNSELKKIFTPRYHKPLDYKAKKRAVLLISGKLKAL